MSNFRKNYNVFLFFFKCLATGHKKIIICASEYSTEVGRKHPVRNKEIKILANLLKIIYLIIITNG